MFGFRGGIRGRFGRGVCLGASQTPTFFTTKIVHFATLYKTRDLISLTCATSDNFRKYETKIDSNKPNLVEAYSKRFCPRVELIADCFVLCRTMEFRLLKCLH